MKKIVKYFLIALLLPIGVFFSLAFFLPSIQYESKITVNKPVDLSFKVFSSPFSLSAWIPGLKNVRWISGKQNVLGSKWEMTIEEGDNEYVVTEELITYKENELFVIRMENEDIINNVEVRFTNKGNESEICSSNHSTAKNFFQKPFFLFFKSSLKKRDEEMYKRLKRLIEVIN